ncbi:Cys-Gln thioester bond-forming surface protein [Streptodolium elevatio]|uniref:Cys-Gln thioester bond-forming surface protein n=1 Tax=Streptodolium elevatio TaxID=3157996 RepID=A0ABV3DM63_9ACTN
MFRTQRGISRMGSACAATGLAAVAVIGMSPAAYADAGKLRFKGHVKDTAGRIVVDRPEQWFDESAGTNLKVLGSGGPEVTVYCIDLDTAVNGSADYREGTWAESWLKDTAKIAKINWVLNNSYPKVTSLAELAEKAGVPKGRKHDGLSPAEAVAATQAAIWYYSNGAKFERVSESGWADKDGDNEDVSAVYKFLTGSANTGLDTEPSASLELDPTKVTGTDGDPKGVGPVTVRTTSTEPVAVALEGTVPTGVSLVDGQGQPITTAADKTELWVKVPKNQNPGAANISAQTKASVNVGRVFIAESRKKSQTFITAGSQPFDVKANAKAEWSHKAVPAPSVAFREECQEGGVSVELKNAGDAPADFVLNGQTIKVPADSGKTELVKVAEDADYSITVTGPGNFSETFAGKLDCVQPPVDPEPTTTPTTEPPTSEPPTSQPPTSEPPTSEPPTSEPPTSEPPTSEPPTSEPPTSSAPTTSKPATSAPATSTKPATSGAPSSPAASSPAASSSAPPAATSPTGGEPPLIPEVEPGTENPPLTIPWVPVGDGQDLAETGGDDNSTTLIAGAAAALLLAGGGAVFLSRRRGGRHQA